MQEREAINEAARQRVFRTRATSSTPSPATGGSPPDLPALQEYHNVDASVSLQIGTTIAGIAVALAALIRDNSRPDVFQSIPFLLLIVGLVCIYASLYAMAALWRSAGIEVNRDLLGGSEDACPHLTQYTYQVLILATWGLWVLTVVYLAMLYDTLYTATFQ